MQDKGVKGKALPFAISNIDHAVADLLNSEGGVGNQKYYSNNGQYWVMVFIHRRAGGSLMDTVVEESFH